MPNDFSARISHEILDNFYRALQISGENSDRVTEDEMKEDIITIWSYMEPYIMMYKKDFLKG